MSGYDGSIGHARCRELWLNIHVYLVVQRKIGQISVEKQVYFATLLISR
ncbi:MAG: hypothetical protein K0Q59_3629 [Paenibacillus sp.]|nr:hypothetical protein [Paenibacillus sp.]